VVWAEKEGGALCTRRVFWGRYQRVRRTQLCCDDDTHGTHTHTHIPPTHTHTHSFSTTTIQPRGGKVTQPCGVAAAVGAPVAIRTLTFADWPAGLAYFKANTVPALAKAPADDHSTFCYANAAKRTITCNQSWKVMVFFCWLSLFVCVGGASLSLSRA
jgi:hypothetical protein